MTRLFLIIAILGVVPPGAGAQTRLGAAQANITPGQPVIMSGYDARKTPSTGTHDSLFASALYFAGDKQKALLITADLIGFPTVMVDTLKSQIAARTGVPRDNILLIAEHNHGGPAIHVYEDQLPAANEDYIRELKQKLVGLAAQAVSNPVPFRMAIAKGVCGLNVNRRAVFADGGVWLGRNPDGACDHELDVVSFTNESGRLLAVMINWPCHGTVSGQDNYQITGDWPAAAARYIRRFAGSGAVVAVTAGASANINPIYGPGNDFSEVEAVGYHVGLETWKLLAPAVAEPAPGGSAPAPLRGAAGFAGAAHPVRSVEMISTTLNFPGKKPWKDRFPETSYPSGSEVPLRITGLKLDDLVLCGISGELMTEMGLAIKAASPYTSTIIVTHCNGASGYICTDKAFSEGGYEPKVSHLMPGVEQPLVAKCLELISSF